MCSPMMALGAPNLMTGVGELVGGKAGRTMTKIGKVTQPGYLAGKAVGAVAGKKAGRAVTKLGGGLMSSGSTEF